MKITVILSGRFRDLFAAPEQLELELQEGATIRDLLIGLCETAGNNSEVFFTSTGLKPNVTVAVNGRFIIHLKWLDTVLSEGDNVKIFTLHCGG